ncbi:Double-stranded RNA-binding domain (DsRBD)-containing protein [Rhynchospora pubera]|uniref:Double-stranded RNA-binding domain (DsRBD)-containing protein n=1 Tax=Rhynchospora pubera TaxID=906938 RepID=A0AAV8GEX8_9POAL|nr:Double-stranded RNA-binding domain (DsRBD)-containing protein [Rhynchospora pubera]
MEETERERVSLRVGDDGHFDPMEMEFINNNKRKSREGTEDNPAMTKVSTELHVQKVHKMGPTEGACSTENAWENSTDFDMTAKLRLFDICSTNKWNCPVYELCEMGSGQNNMFTYKVTVLIDTYSLTVLEAFSAPNCQREAAEVHAAEGALWYLRHLGYCS